MKKFHLWVALIGLLALGFGSFLMPDSGAFWLTSSSLEMQAVRIALIVVVTIHLVTNPPRHLVIRSLTGGVAIMTLWYALTSLSQMNTPLFDSLMLMYVSIGLGIAALELPAEHTIFIRDQTSL